MIFLLFFGFAELPGAGAPWRASELGFLALPKYGSQIWPRRVGVVKDFKGRRRKQKGKKGACC